MDKKTCRQCGRLKDVSDFRLYYNRDGSRYTYCRECEAVNSREKYLRNKKNKSTEEVEELEQIHNLYRTQLDRGLNPPRIKGVLEGRHKPAKTIISELMDMYGAVPEDRPQQPVVERQIPAELLAWMELQELKEKPEYYINEVYEKLLAKYKPVLYVDNNTSLPVHDETYKDILEDILNRFYEYEDNYEERWDD